jgi:hypothetical protein
LVHSGQVGDAIDLGDVTEALDVMVSSILLGEIYETMHQITFKKGKVPGFGN